MTNGASLGLVAREPPSPAVQAHRTSRPHSPPAAVSRPVGRAPDWAALKAFCRATDGGQATVRIFQPLPPNLADRTALGHALLSLEAIIPAAQLKVTVSQSQLKRLQTTPALMPLLNAYWVSFQPFLERTYSPQPGAEGPDFALVLTFLTAIMPGGLGPLMPLAGVSPADRWVRNLHRFPLPMLIRLVVNLGDTTGTREFVLVLHAGHDAPSAFAKTGSLISALVMNTGGVAMFGPNNFVLMIEGASSLADMTARIPAITATFGKKTGGTRRINQVVIVGHGSGHTIGMAGAGAPVVAGGEVRYPEESLDTSQPNTKALLDALLTRMDPATARILFFGCLVGSRTVSAGTPAAARRLRIIVDQGQFRRTLVAATLRGRRRTPAGPRLVRAGGAAPGELLDRRPYPAHPR